MAGENTPACVKNMVAIARCIRWKETSSQCSVFWVLTAEHGCSTSFLWVFCDSLWVFCVFCVLCFMCCADGRLPPSLEFSGSRQHNTAVGSRSARSCNRHMWAVLFMFAFADLQTFSFFGLSFYISDHIHLLPKSVTNENYMLNLSDMFDGEELCWLSLGGGGA